MTKIREQEIQGWKLLLQERLDRGLSVSQFCKDKGITENMYYHRLRVVRKAEPEFTNRIPENTTSVPTDTFVELKAQPAEPVMCPSEAGVDRTPVAVIKVDFMEIGLFQNASAPFLEDLLKAVRHA